MAFAIRSPAFENGTPIPPKYTRDGENISPPLQWRDVPAGTESLALIIEDPDAPSGVFRHWAVYNIKPTQKSLAEGMNGIRAEAFGCGVNDFGNARYDGPQPPQDDDAHHYHFRLLALDVPSLDLLPTAKAGDVLATARDHMIDEVELVGTFKS
ncbi:MAG TPA: YbhB/YbcL family Raf kinase inhibitor-like protein [Alphaproteobacteria bacterium]